MAMLRLWARAVVWAALLALSSSSAFAQDSEPVEGEPAEPPSSEPSAGAAPVAPPPVAPPPSEPPAAAEDEDAAAIISAAQKEKARERFKKGVSLFEQQAWTAALAEFLASRELFPTRSATKNAAVCFRRLERFDESLDMFESLLREFPDLDADGKAFAQRQITELRTLVGTIDIDGSEPGAMVIVNGRTRADYPLISPLRVPAGSHTIRVFKEGYEPFETRVDVAGGQRITIEALLAELESSGRLRVKEKSGQAIDVVVDGAVVGKAPWEGLLGIGPHVVLLRGEGNLGSEPVEASVRAGKVTALTLIAEELESSILVKATPGAAVVTVDSVPVGRGVWEGLLRTGPHWVEVSEYGFVPERTQVSLKRGQKKVVDVSLERDLGSPRWQIPSRITAEVDGGVAMIPSFGGDVAGSCGSECTQTLGVGGIIQGRAGYEWGSGFGLGLALGYMAAGQQLDGRETEVTPQGLGSRSGVASDDLALSGVLVGVTGSYRMGEEFPLTLRAGVGAMFGKVSDVRTASFRTSGGTFNAPEIGDDPSAAFLYVDPEARIGWALAERFEVSLGLQALLLITVDTPTWGEEEDLPVVLPESGYSGYANDELTGPLILALVPGLGARYSF